MCIAKGSFILLSILLVAGMVVITASKPIIMSEISPEENRNKQILITSHTCVVHVSLCFGWSHVTTQTCSISPILSDG